MGVLIGRQKRVKSGAFQSGISSRKTEIHLNNKQQAIDFDK